MRLRSRWIGPVRIDIYVCKDLTHDDGTPCDGIFDEGEGLGPATIWIDSKAPESTLYHEWLHAVEHYFGIWAADHEELRVTVLELLKVQWDR